LRDRSEDIELLVAHFIARCNVKLSKSVSAVSDDVMALFCSYSWPGNVRELEHAIEHACILCKDPIIALSDLPQDLLDSATLPGVSLGKTIPVSSASVPKLSLEEALAAAGGNKARAARLLGISRMTLYRQLGSLD
jgi:transcriptional regulator with PAS, ATPase and Fis domain